MARLGFPVVVNHSSLVLMQFTDAWIAGRLGSTELAAITPAAVLVGLLSIFGIETLTGVTAHVSQSVGKGRASAAGRIAWQGVYCGLLFGWMCLIYYPAAGPVFRNFFPGQSGELVSLETQYFQVSLFGIAPLMVSYALGNFFTGTGSTRTVMVAALTGVLSNILISSVLAFGLPPWSGIPLPGNGGFLLPSFRGFDGIGFAGLAWGTVLASLIQGLVLMSCFLLPLRTRTAYGTHQAGFSRKRAAGLLRTGLPAGIHGSADYLAWGVILTWLISFSGEAHLAAQSIMVRCITLSFLPADGLASALTTLVGKAVGARDYLLARRYARGGFILIGGWMSMMAVIYLVFGHWIVRLFTDDPAVIAAGSTAILWVAAFQFFDAMNVTYTNALQGAGDTAWPSAVNFTLSILILLGAGFGVVTFFPDTASSGVWAVATFYIVCQGLIFYRRWKTRAWQNPAFLV